MSFTVVKKSKKSKARCVSIKTTHGKIQAPFFMPDATYGAIRSLTVAEAKSLNIQACVVNTLHLYLKPGAQLIKSTGGIHNFMKWDGPLLSDSGGFQVYSLIHKNKKMGKITEKGAVFRSPSDGSQHLLTPEKSIQIQFDLGVDMMVCLDDVPPHDFSKVKIIDAVERTIRWAKRCKKEYDKQCAKRKLTGSSKPLLFAVIQGGTYSDVRKHCASELIKIGFDGYGYGARPVDTEGNFMSEILQVNADLIPKDSLKFALGTGTPLDIVRCSKMGWDIFDCVIPTREARHGRLYMWEKNSSLKKNTFYSVINIQNAKFAKDFTSINNTSLHQYTKAYLHHLFKMREPLAQRLATINNLTFYTDLMKKIRKEIKSGTL